MKASDFISIDNFKQIATLTNEFLTDTFDFKMYDNDPDIKKRIYDVMNEVLEILPAPARTVTKLNFLAIKRLKEFYIETHGLKTIKQQISQPKQSREDMNSDFLKLQEARQSIQIPAGQTATVLQPESTKNDKAISETDFMNELALKQSEREKSVKGLFGSDTIFSPTPKKEALEEFTSMMHSTHSMTSRNEVVSDIMSDNHAQPADIYRHNFEKHDAAKQYIAWQNKGTVSNQSLLNPLPKQYIEQENYIAVNSIDRNWQAYPLRNRFTFTMNGSSDTVAMIPLFENNAFDPYTGISNTSGFVNVETGDAYLKYNGQEGKGLLKGFAKKIVRGTNSANLITPMKNIVSIQVSKIVVPIEIITSRSDASMNSVNARTKNIYETNFSINFPYVLLTIDELENNYIATNDLVRKTFCYLMFSSCYTDTNGRSYAILEPSQEEKKLFRTPLSSLQTMSISLLKPNGELLNHGRDCVSIVRLSYLNSVPDYIEIICGSYFDKNEWYLGDYIQIINIILPVCGSMSEDYTKKIEGFINRLEGHQIYQMGAPNANGYYNSFYIRAPGTFNRDIGAFEPNLYLLQQLVKFNEINTDGVSLTGILLNMSLQNCLTFKMVTLIADVEEIGSLPI